MKLTDLHSDTLIEWMLPKSPEFKLGYEHGNHGILRKSDNKDYVKGWKIGYYKFFCRKQPELC